MIKVRHIHEELYRLERDGIYLFDLDNENDALRAKKEINRLESRIEDFIKIVDELRLNT